LRASKNKLVELKNGGPINLVTFAGTQNGELEDIFGRFQGLLGFFMIFQIFGIFV
jgi:hypothetical protein